MDFDEKDDDVDMYGGATSAEDDEFDQIVGYLEEVIYSAEFINAQAIFLNKHCGKFTDFESENKLEHTEIFQKYTTFMEDCITKMLTEKMPNFQLNRFESMLVNRKDEIDHEIFNVMLSMGSYVDFKELIVSHKKSKEETKGGEKLDLGIVGRRL